MKRPNVTELLRFHTPKPSNEQISLHTDRTEDGQFGKAKWESDSCCNDSVRSMGDEMKKESRIVNWESELGKKIAARSKEQRKRKADVCSHFGSSADTKLGEMKTDSGSHASSSQCEQEKRRTRS